MILVLKMETGKNLTPRRRKEDRRKLRKSMMGTSVSRTTLSLNECVIRQELLPYVCETCGRFSNLTNFTQHSEARECKTVVDMTNKHKCINCNLSFFTLRNRETHVRKAHMPPGETQYRCARCDINFVSHKDFNLRKKKHFIQ